MRQTGFPFKQYNRTITEDLYNRAKGGGEMDKGKSAIESQIRMINLAKEIVPYSLLHLPSLP
ncbi:hypothetical protein KN1_25630 [Stygiolobus caldivivus]|uniref:Uncharacterized protein n=2 Tax=Stygiolobus caldivivus TaxID=2824673 RepID=A0A8D5ZK20_9CREN|nr:hypothetical protein KN1_25630 [Stygiolobus caldivivus]